jgi:hypothetical protein
MTVYDILYLDISASMTLTLNSMTVADNYYFDNAARKTVTVGRAVVDDILYLQLYSVVRMTVTAASVLMVRPYVTSTMLVPIQQ